MQFILLIRNQKSLIRNSTNVVQVKSIPGNYVIYIDRSLILCQFKSAQNFDLKLNIKLGLSYSEN